MLDHVRRLPGVEAASQSGRALFSGYGWSSAVRLPGRPIDGRESFFLEVSDGFFETMRIPRRDGRTFVRDDSRREPRLAVVVNEAFARRYFEGEPAIGRTFSRDDRNGPIDHEIVGIVADAKYRSVRDPAPATVYLPLKGIATLQVRTASDPLSVAPMLQREVQGLDASLRVSSVTLQSTLVGNTLLRERLLALLAGFFATVALVLVGVGLYGVLSYTVLQRTREIGIRAALGAGRLAAVREVLAKSVLALAVGTAVGLGVGAYLSRFVEALLFDIEPVSVWALSMPVAVLIVTGLIAAVLPALRAARVDPVVALRFE
jgi:predicted permease